MEINFLSTKLYEYGHGFIRHPSKWNANQVKAKTNMLKKGAGENNCYIWNRKNDPNKVLELKSLTTHVNCEWHWDTYISYLHEKWRAGWGSRQELTLWLKVEVCLLGETPLPRERPFSFLFKTWWSPSIF